MKKGEKELFRLLSRNISSVVALASVLVSLAAFAVFMVMMVMAAFEIGIGFQFSGKILSDGFDDIAADSADNLDSMFRKRRLRASADSAAEKDVHIAFFEESGKRAVSAVSRRDDLHSADESVLNLEDCKGRGVPEMLEDFFVFTCCRDDHFAFSCFMSLIRVVAPAAATACRFVQAAIFRRRFEISVRNHNIHAGNQCGNDFAASGVEQALDRAARNPHPDGCFSLFHLFQIDEMSAGTQNAPVKGT